MPNTPIIIESTPNIMPSIYSMWFRSKNYTDSLVSTFRQRLALTLGAKQNQRNPKQW